MKVRTSVAFGNSTLSSCTQTMFKSSASSLHKLFRPKSFPHLTWEALIFLKDNFWYTDKKLRFLWTRSKMSHSISGANLWTRACSEKLSHTAMNREVDSKLRQCTPRTCSRETNLTKPQRFSPKARSHLNKYTWFLKNMRKLSSSTLINYQQNWLANLSKWCSPSC